MPRARNIKPAFFKNEELSQCAPNGRLLFIALWCEADREGRLLDRPLRLKAEYFPYDSCDIDVLLAQLAGLGLIQRYEVNGCKYIAIPKFRRHQNPHRDEPSRNYPPPETAAVCAHGATTMQTPCDHGSGTNARRLNPESCFLNPKTKTKPADIQRSVGKTPEQAAGLEISDPERVRCDAERLAKTLGVSGDDFEFGHRVAALVAVGKLTDRMVTECASEARAAAIGSPIGLFRTKLRCACKRKRINLESLVKAVVFPADYYHRPPDDEEVANVVADLAESLARKDAR